MRTVSTYIHLGAIWLSSIIKELLKLLILVCYRPPNFLNFLILSYLLDFYFFIVLFYHHSYHAFIILNCLLGCIITSTCFLSFYYFGDVCIYLISSISSFVLLQCMNAYMYSSSIISCILSFLSISILYIRCDLILSENIL